MVQTSITCSCGAGTQTHAQHEKTNKPYVHSTKHSGCSMGKAACSFFMSQCKTALVLYRFHCRKVVSCAVDMLLFVPCLLAAVLCMKLCLDHSSSALSLFTCTLAWQVFYIETISNPLLEIPDIPAVAAFCQQKGLTSVSDNTFASPAVFRCILLLVPALCSCQLKPAACFLVCMAACCVFVICYLVTAP